MKENLLDKIKKILKRAISVAGATLTLMLPSSDAAEQKNVDKEIEGNRTKFVEELKEGTSTTEAELKKFIEDSTDREEISTNDYETINEKLTIKEETTTSNKNKNNNQQNIELYNRLLNKLNNESNKKGFSEIVYKHLKAAFDNLYINYDEWQEISKDLPTKEKYITDNLINNIKNVNNIYFYSINSKEAQERLAKGYGVGHTDDEFNIFIISNDSNSEIEFQKETEILLHELNHIDQKKIVFNKEFFKKYPYLKDTILEGGAASGVQYVKELKTEKQVADTIKLGDYTLEYKADAREGYQKELYFYNNIMFLVGYNAIERIDSDEQKLDSIKNSIQLKYGEKIANEIFDELENLNNAYKEGNNEEKMQAATNLQKNFLKCIEKDIAELKTKEEVIKYTNVYRAYKINNLAKIYKDNIEFTNEYFNIEGLDKKMADKIIKTQAFKFSENSKENENAIKCLLYTTNESFYQKDGIYEGIYVPPNLCKVNYEYKDGKLILNYDNRTEIESANRDNVNIEMTVVNGKVQVKETEEKCKNLKPIINNTRIIEEAR